MTPAILLVTTSLYNEPASNSQTRFAKAPPRFQWCQPYARPSEVYTIHGPPDLSEVSRTYENLPYRK
jgi:hypothetical protein